MLDPFTCLNIATAVVQFVDFTSQLVTEGYQSFQSVAGALQEDVNAQSLAADLQALCGRLANTAPTNVSLTLDEYSIQSLAKQCRDLARELFVMLESFRVNSHGATRGWQAAGKAIRKMSKREKIDKMQRQLERIKTQLNTHLLNVVRNDQSVMMQAVNELAANTRKLNMAAQDQVAGLRTDVLTALQRQQNEITTLRQSSREQGHGSGNFVHSSIPHCVEVLSVMEKFAAEGKFLASKQRILRSLSFAEERLRHAEIKEAYSETFTWLFDDKITSFQDWLANGSGVFWINGYAGSGKSTIMKFLADHDLTQQALEVWASADDKTLVTAQFYFWNSGNPMQKTAEGLLQSLLVQILRQFPDLIPILFPKRMTNDDNLPWEYKELLTALNAILSGEYDLATKFCFFIDAMNEFEGEHSELISHLQTLVQSDDVKFCVSSRPWTEYNDAFGKTDHQSIKLQDLTRDDMDIFVRGLLGSNPRFVELAKHEHRAQAFISDILDRANGVFLWVYLAVRSLLRGLAQHDNIRILEKRLNALPTDLESYYRHIFRSIEDVYLDLSARAFHLMLQSAPLPLTTTLCLLEGVNAQQAVLGRQTSPLTPREADALEQDATYYLQAWCRDLLAVHVLPDKLSRSSSLHSCRIDFLHGTVRDFLRLREVQESLDRRIQSDFDSWLTLMSALMFEAKSLKMTKSHDGMREFVNLAGEIMHCAKQIESSHNVTPSDMLNELDRVGCHYRAQHGRLKSHWSNALHPANSNMLAYAVSFDLTLYVKEVLTREGDGRVSKARWRLLDFVLQNKVVHDKLSPERLPSLDMVQILVHAGADVNHASKPQGHSNATPWQRFLCRCHNTGDNSLFPIIHFLLENDADVEVKVETSRKTPRVTGWQRTPPTDTLTHATVEACIQQCCKQLGPQWDSVLPLLSRKEQRTWWRRWSSSSSNPLAGLSVPVRGASRSSE